MYASILARGCMAWMMQNTTAASSVAHGGESPLLCSLHWFDEPGSRAGFISRNDVQELSCAHSAVNEIISTILLGPQQLYKKSKEADNLLLLK